MEPRRVRLSKASVIPFPLTCVNVNADIGVWQVEVNGDITTLVLTNLRSQTEYDVAVTPIYDEGPGITMIGSAITGELIILTDSPRWLDWQMMLVWQEQLLHGCRILFVTLVLNYTTYWLQDLRIQQVFQAPCLDNDCHVWRHPYPSHVYVFMALFYQSQGWYPSSVPADLQVFLLTHNPLPFTQERVCLLQLSMMGFVRSEGSHVHGSFYMSHTFSVDFQMWFLHRRTWGFLRWARLHSGPHGSMEHQTSLCTALVGPRRARTTSNMYVYQLVVRINIYIYSN